ncbi:PIG-L family deacetylase [Longispora sp. NPDC051575]|uniref:PIG-L family deacetylase n=1 Tax=Longispora sp. NPDC051575 TaxID=3154943 RepID=UPI0034331427
MRILRRGPIAVLSVLLAAAVTATPPPASAEPGPASPETAAAGPEARTERLAQIVAHPDDEILFLNPDLQRSAEAGYANTTVFLTAGDADRGPGYSRSRQDGAMEAHRHMAGAPACATPRACWTQDAWAVGAGVVQRFTLTARPTVQLIFLNVRDGYDSGGSCDLMHLWTDGSFTAAPVVPDDATDPAGVGATRYTHDSLRDTVVAILRAVRPTLVRGQDPHPDHRYQPGYRCLGRTFDDHYDHVASALFAEEITAAYGGRLATQFYRQNNIQTAVPNLTEGDRALKDAVFRHYIPYDDATRDPAGNPAPVYVTYSRVMYARFPRGTAWVGRTGDGWLQPFVVLGGRVLTWRQTGDGTYAGPVDLGGPGVPVTGVVSVGNNADGRLEIFVVGADDSAAVHTTYQRADGEWVGHWDNFGNPNDTVTPQVRRAVSGAAVGSNADGRLQIFVTNGNGGLGSKWQTSVNGPWTPGWLDMGGSDIQGVPVAVTNDDGRLEVFAATRAGVDHRYQVAPNSPFVSHTLPVRVAGPVNVAKNADGRLELFYRGPNTGDVAHLYQTAVNGDWGGGPLSLGGHGGVGELETVTSAGRILVFGRNQATGVSHLRQTAQGWPAAWTDSAGASIDTPSVALDRTGRVVMFQLAPDGRLLMAAQKTPDPDSPFRPWVPLP